MPRTTNAPASREDLQKYFASALASNKTFSQIVTDLLTATGSPRPGTDDYNPAVNFLLDGMTNDATAPTISTVLSSVVTLPVLRRCLEFTAT